MYLFIMGVINLIKPGESEPEISKFNYVRGIQVIEIYFLLCLEKEIATHSSIRA